MYYTVQQTAENLEIDLGYLMHLIQTKQVKTVEVDGELLLNSAQFDFFLKQRERLLEEYQKYLDEPIPEDIDIKDEDQEEQREIKECQTRKLPNFIHILFQFEEIIVFNQ